MKFLRYLVLFLMIIPGLTVFAQQGYYPPPANVAYHNDTLLTICPPDSLPGPACDSAIVIYGYELPFLEDWSSGSFEELQWTPSSGNWVISNEEGNPAPTAEFRGDPAQTDYTMNLESFPINATGLIEGKIWLDFDLQLDCITPTGTEILRVEIWNWTHKVWDPVAEFDNYNGSFMWAEEHINIKPNAMNKVFKVRFLSAGVNTSDIQGWLVDNIHIYRQCEAASNLVINENPEYNKLTWNGWGTCGGVYPWIHWDDGLISANSFGTGGPVEFDVAARWESAQLGCFEGASIYFISYFPLEINATYRIRIWTGTEPDSLIYDKPVNPIIGQWNTNTLVTPQPIDFTKDLWVGYHVSTATGYPAGLDDGPAINGYGNMIRFEGAWKTLLELNPDLNYNWNIECYLWPTSNPPNPEVNYNIYRQTNNDEFQFYDVTGYDSYIDSNIILTDYYCYQVKMLWAKDGDTCESDPTNTACDTVNVGTDQLKQDKTIKIYPNPAKNWLMIESEEDIREIRLYNLLGDEVLKLEIGNSDYQLDVSRLQSGIYYVNVTTICKEFKDKIVILR